jgi:predicted acyltransferase
VAGVPLLIAAVVVAGVAAALLPEARSRSRYGVGAIGLAVSVAAAAGGSPLVAMPLVLVVWGVAALLAARPPR